MSAFPKDLAIKVTKRWNNIVAGDYVTPPLPPDKLLRQLLEMAYLAAAMPEEGRYPQFNLLVVPKDDTVERFLGEVWNFDNDRPFSVSELRRLAPAVDYKKSAILVRWADKGLAITGLADLGTSWARARTGLQYDYQHPTSLFIQIDRPGKIKVYQGQFLIAELADGELKRLEGFDFHLALHEPVGRSLTKLRDEIVVPKNEYPRDYHSFEFTALWNVFAAIANSIGEEAHGGALVLVPSLNLPTEKQIRIKYRQNSDVLRKAFLAFMNARNKVIDFVIRLEMGKETKSVKSGWALAELELLRSQSDLVEAIRFIARLAGCDGAIILSDDLRLLGFGAEIRVELESGVKIKEVTHEMRRLSRAMDVEQFGLRHRSAIKLVSKLPDCCALVVSQDGPISVVWSEKEKHVNVRKGVNLTNMNMPWA